jgi:hypothetical protein
LWRHVFWAPTAALHGGGLRAIDRTVFVRIQPVEYRIIKSDKFILADSAVSIGIHLCHTRAGVAAALAHGTISAIRRRQKSILINIHPREGGLARSAHFILCDAAIIVGVGAEKSLRPIALSATLVCQGNAGAREARNSRHC